MGKEERKQASKEAKALRKARKAAEKEKARKLLEEGTAPPVVAEEPAEDRKDKKKKRKLEEDAEEEPKKSKKSKNAEQSTDDAAETAQAPVERKDKKEKNEKKEKKDKKEKKEKKSKKEEETPEDCKAENGEAAEMDTMQQDFIAFEPEIMEGVITNGEDSSKKDKKKKSKKDKKDKKANGASKTDKPEVIQNEDSNGATEAANGVANSDEQAESDAAPKKNQRFIVFVGNLPYTATKKDIEEHFAKIAPSDVRLMTEKKTGKSKGFAFLDFDGYDKMKTCLKLYHHSVFKDGTKKGRQINVELTAGGGGNTEDRKAKIQAKNVKLSDERQRRREAEEKQQQRKEAKEARQKKNKGELQEEGAVKAPPIEQAPSHEGIHPSRLKQMRF